MKRVGVLTFHFADNYGAVMQAYGLITCLRSLKLDAHIINYHPDYVEGGGSFRFPCSKNDIRANFVISYQKIIKIRNRLIADGGLREKFNEFRKNHLYISDPNYKTIESLRVSPPLLDVYIAGSDQIWNPSEQYGVDPAYFLDFGSPFVRRISYAASFGRDVLAKDSQKKIGELLRRFDAISIRECSGVDIIKNISNLSAKWLPDPTFLVDDYQQIIKKPKEVERYMMSYVLRSGKGVSEIQTYLAKRMKLKIIVPYNPMKRWKGVGETIYPGPEEWLGYMRYADFVVTNSFHGTVFSVLFNKPFITIGLTGKKGGLNERAKSLLERLGLEERLLTEFTSDKADLLMKQDIDWEAVNKRVAEWKTEALAFIKKEVAD
ncbi:MAG TPA: polysaccharide pyruvyl transferase family protein [Gammaproteobacteria bacterium]|nr:polysaccharide pyruvyl transferase family protein [Gammaproteobacteria bacterium]